MFNRTSLKMQARQVFPNLRTVQYTRHVSLNIQGVTERTPLGAFSKSKFT